MNRNAKTWLAACAAALIIVASFAYAEDSKTAPPTAPPADAPTAAPQDPKPAYARGVVTKIDLDKDVLTLTVASPGNAPAVTQDVQLTADGKVRLASNDGALLRPGVFTDIETGMYAIAAGEYSSTPNAPFVSTSICAGRSQEALDKLMKTNQAPDKTGPQIKSDDKETSDSQKVKVY